MYMYIGLILVLLFKTCKIVWDGVYSLAVKLNTLFCLLPYRNILKLRVHINLWWNCVFYIRKGQSVHSNLVYQKNMSAVFRMGQSKCWCMIHCKDALWPESPYLQNEIEFRWRCLSYITLTSYFAVIVMNWLLLSVFVCLFVCLFVFECLVLMHAEAIGRFVP